MHFDFLEHSRNLVENGPFCQGNLFILFIFIYLEWLGIGLGLVLEDLGRLGIGLGLVLEDLGRLGIGLRLVLERLNFFNADTPKSLHKIIMPLIKLSPSFIIAPLFQAIIK